MRAMVVVTVDSLVEMFKDYLGEENLPADAKPVRLMVKPSEMGRFALEVESDRWQGEQPPLNVDFKIRRYLSVGG